MTPTHELLVRVQYAMMRRLPAGVRERLERIEAYLMHRMVR